VRPLSDCGLLSFWEESRLGSVNLTAPRKPLNAHSERWVTNYSGHIGNTLGFFWEVPRDAMEGDLCDGREDSNPRLPTPKTGTLEFHNLLRINKLLK